MTERNKERRELIAQQYANKHGIVGYKVDGNRMIYYENSETEPKCTTKVIVRLNTLQVTRQKLTYWNPKGDLNMKGERNEEKMAL